MNNMKDAFEEALKKRGEKPGHPVLSIKISMDKSDDTSKEDGVAPHDLPPEDPHADPQQMNQEHGAQEDAAINPIQKKSQLIPSLSADDQDTHDLLAKRAGMGTSRQPRTLSERAAADYMKKKKA